MVKQQIRFDGTYRGRGEPPAGFAKRPPNIALGIAAKGCFWRQIRIKSSTSISEKADRRVLHDLRPNRRSKLRNNALDRLRVSDTGIFPSLQILTLRSACTVPDHISNNLSYFKIDEHVSHQQFPMIEIQPGHLFCFEHARHIVVE